MQFDANPEKASWLPVLEDRERQFDALDITFISHEGGDLAAWGPVAEVAAELHDVVNSCGEVVLATAEDGTHAFVVIGGGFSSGAGSALSSAAPLAWLLPK